MYFIGLSLCRGGASSKIYRDMEATYSTGGYSISGLKRLQNTSGEMRDGWIERQEEEKEEPTQIQRIERKPATHRKHTQDFKEEVRRLKKEGVPRKEIADRFGLSLKAVEHILYDKPVLLTGTKGRELTEKELRWFIKHYQHTRNDEIQVKLNITYSSLHRIARQYGLKKSRQFMKRTQEEATRKAKESHEMNGTYPPKGYIITKSEEFRLKKGIGMRDRRTRKQIRETTKKRIASRNETIAKEKRRILYGFEQQTKMRLVCEPTNKKSLRHNMKRRGYEVERGGNILRITAETQRSEICEKHAIALGFTLVEI